MRYNNELDNHISNKISYLIRLSVLTKEGCSLAESIAISIQFR